MINEQTEDLLNDFFKEVSKAEEEAMKQEIETNTIILNEEFDFCRELYSCLNLNGYKNGDVSFRRFPPLILGKKVFIGKLPEKYTFALTFSNIENLDEHMDHLEKENTKLRDKLNKIKELFDYDI